MTNKSLQQINFKSKSKQIQQNLHTGQDSNYTNGNLMNTYSITQSYRTCILDKKKKLADTTTIRQKACANDQKQPMKIHQTWPFFF